MATLTIRHFNDSLKAELQVRAARHGRSMEAEVREILQSSLTRPDPAIGMGTRIWRHFAEVGGVELPLPPRTELPRAAEFPDEEDTE